MRSGDKIIVTTDHSPAYHVGQMCPLQDFLDDGLRLLQKLSLTHCWVPSSNVLTHVTIRQETPPPQSRVQFCQGPTRHLKLKQQEIQKEDNMDQVGHLVSNIYIFRVFT